MRGCVGLIAPRAGSGSALSHLGAASLCCRLAVKSREVVDALDEQIRAFCAPLLQSLNG